MRLSRLARTPFAFWLAVAGLALATAVVVAGALNRVEALADQYGPLRPVVVAARAVERGAALVPADVAVRHLPAGYLPPDGFASVDEVRDLAPVVPLLPGQPLQRGHLAPDGVTGAAALLPPGARAVAVPAGSSAPTLKVGDVVDVLATVDSSPTVALAADALVVEAGEDTASVAVSPEAARAVIFALAHGSVTLVLAPAAPPQRNPVARSPSTTAPAATR